MIADAIDGRLQAETLANDLLAALDEPIRLRGEDVFAGASIGIAVFPDDGKDSEELRGASDSALYEMKRLHRRGERLAPETRAAG